MRVLFKFLSLLPLSWLHGIGTLLGRLVWGFSPTYRRHLYENMRLALGNDFSKALYHDAIAHAGKTALETPKIWMRPLDEVIKMVAKVSGLELIDAALQEGKGIIYLTPHLGCFEITAQYLSTKSPLTVLYRPPKMKWMHDVFKAGRSREQMRNVPVDLSGVRAMFKALKQGEAVGILPDQAPKGGGVWPDFFGKPAYTMTFAGRLTESHAAIILVAAIRLPESEGYHLQLSSPAAPICGSVEERAQLINHEMERLIRRCPEQYLWGYNRYKRPAGAEPPPATPAI